MSVQRSETDVCIVGAGAAGAVIAAELATRGVDVTVLESGPRYELAERAAAQKRFLRGLHPFPSPDPGLDRYTVDSELTFRLEWMRMRGIGGSTLHWEGYAMRFHPSDFELRSRWGVGLDWPFDYDALEPFYARAERALGVAGAEPDATTFPRSVPFPLPPFPRSYSDGVFARACDQLGIHMVPLPQARNSEPYDGRTACLACGTCYVCPIGARASVDLTHVPRAEATGRATFVDRAHVLKLECEGDRVASALYRRSDGSDHRLHARRFILAGGAIENVRLCLLSASRAHPDGLANRSGLLGANFLCHPVVDFTALVPEQLYPYRTGFSSSMSRDFIATEGRARRAGFWIEFRNRAGGTPAELARDGGTWGAALRDKVRAEFGRRAGMRVFLEQLPSLENRITLDPAEVDSYGSPIAHVTFGVGDYERAGAREASAVVRRIYAAMDADEVRESRLLLASHLLGTHRMGSDPDTSVVDDTQRVHEIPNLWLAGGGSFPTGGWANPTLTIVALALRTADAVVAG